MKHLIKILFFGLITLFLLVFLSMFENKITENNNFIIQKEVVLDTNISSTTVEDFEENLENINIEKEQKQKEETIKIPEEVIIENLEEEATADIEQIKEEVEDLSKVSFSKINEITRTALVNIFCTTKSGGYFNPTTGSGIIIDERGIILTNAHVAQYFLLKNYLTENFVDCVIRVGSPAKTLYRAKLIFISPSWIKNNANNINEQSPKGTGEDDYALLLITERTDSTKTIPDSFSFIEILYDTEDIKKGDRVLLVAYPAGFLGGISVSKDLYISSSVVEIMDLFTFKEGTFDLFSIGGSVVAQKGSSGGAVVNTENKLIGIIVTSSIEETTADRDLRAITISHINRSFTKDTGFSLQTFFEGNMLAEANAFNTNIAPTLTQFLVDELEK